MSYWSSFCAIDYISLHLNTMEEKLKNPITGVFITIEFEEGFTLKSDSFDLVKQQFSNEPDALIKNLFRAQLKFIDNKEVDSTHIISGIEIITRNFTFGVRETTMYYGITSEYKNWMDFLNKALELFSKFLTLLKIERINRLFLEFINTITLPGVKLEFNEYLNFYPYTETLKNSFITGSNMQVALVDFSDKILTKLTHNFESADDLKYKLILDIHSTIKYDNTNEVNHNVEIIEKANLLYDYIKEIYKDCFTQKTHEMFTY